MTLRKSAIISSMAFSLFAAAFQVLYGLGLFDGMAWGGAKQSSGTMAASLVAAGILVAIAGHYASMAGWLPALLNAKWQRRVEFGLLGFFTLEFVANLASPSSAERMLWVPITALLFISNAFIVFVGRKAKGKN